MVLTFSRFVILVAPGLSSLLYTISFRTCTAKLDQQALSNLSQMHLTMSGSSEGDWDSTVPPIKLNMITYAYSILGMDQESQEADPHQSP